MISDYEKSINSVYFYSFSIFVKSNKSYEYGVLVDDCIALYDYINNDVEYTFCDTQTQSDHKQNLIQIINQVIKNSYILDDYTN